MKASVIIKWVIRCVSIVAPVYFLLIFYENWQAIRSTELGVLFWSSILVTMIVYGCSMMLLAANWASFLDLTTENFTGHRRAFNAYNRTQIAKYLPGNVFHLVGRHMDGHDGGSTHKSLTVSLALESSTLLFGAGLAVLIGISILHIPLDHEVFTLINLAAPILVWITAGVLTIAVIYLVIGKSAFIKRALRILFKTSAITFVFFILYGSLFLIIAYTLGIDPSIQVHYICLIGWIVGYVAIGMPAGIGVREAILLLLLSPLIPDEQALILIACFRLVTTGGDFVLYLIGIMMSRQSTDLAATSD